MKTARTIAEMKAAARKVRAGLRTVGFVPTMGFLHEGHLSLVRESRRIADFTMVSIFVNPLQFGPKEDFKKYPRDLERDSELLEKEGIDYLFFPEEREMYPEGFETAVEVQGLQDRLCGRTRPGHFRGVATVVLKLLNIVQPNFAFFGQKDAQQAIILRRMVKDLNLDVDIRVMPIVREPDGLALSSRNSYLSPKERRASLVLSQSLAEVRQAFESGERRAGLLVKRLKETIAAEPLARLDYAELVDLENLEPVDLIDRDVLAAVAAYIGRTRLIDNAVLAVKGKNYEKDHA
jgi:pantoate--beta-alanine ligase